MELKTTKMSLRAKLMRKMLKFLSEYLAKNGKNICDPSIVVGREKEWKVPKSYRHDVIDCGNYKLEIIKKGDGNPDGKLIYHLHGGGYTMPLANSNRKFAVKLSGISGNSDVILLDYRIAPEVTYPAPLEDALDGWNRLLEMGYKENNIALFGESAGGNLCLALTAKQRNEGKKLPCGLLLMSPWADLAAKGPSYDANLYIDPLFGLNKYVKEPNMNTNHLYAGDTPLDDPILSPAYGSFSGFPPMMIQAGTEEMLFSDSETVCRKALEAGVDINGQAYTGMFHSFQQLAQHLPESKIAWNEAGRFLQKIFLK